MSNDLDDGLEFLGDEMKDNFSETVTYSRGEDDVEVSAGRGSTEYTVDNGLEAFVEPYESHDFLVVAADLVLDDEPIEPERGDIITDGDENEYEVTAPNGVDVYSADSFGRIYRIHTKAR